MLDISQKDLEEVFITNIEKNNIDKVKKYLSSGINVDAILHSRQTIWDTNYFSILGKINVDCDFFFEYKALFDIQFSSCLLCWISSDCRFSYRKGGQCQPDGLLEIQNSSPLGRRVGQR